MIGRHFILEVSEDGTMSAVRTVFSMQLVVPPIVLVAWNPVSGLDLE